jgi:hypothetical protein
MILEGGTKDDMRIFEALFEGVITYLGYEPSKSQLKIMLPKRRCWKDEQKMTCGFSKHVSSACVMFFPPSKIFVWEHKDDDSMIMCLSNSQDDDSTPTCLSNSQHDGSMPMCL